MGERRLYPDGSSGNSFALKTVYGGTLPLVPGDEMSVGVGHFGGNGTAEGIPITNENHSFYGTPRSSFSVDFYPTEYPRWKHGREYSTVWYTADNPTALKKVDKVWQQSPPFTGAELERPNNPRVVEVTTTLSDTNQVAKTTSISPIDSSIGFDQFNNPTDVWEYDFGAGAAGTFKRRTHTDYVTDTNYTSNTGAHLRGLPVQTWVSSDTAGSSKTSLAQFEYDNYTSGGNYAALVSRSNVAGHDTTNFGANYTRRGNVTKVTSYENAAAQTGAVSVYSQYDILGNLVKTIDAKNNISTLSYNDNFGLPDSEARSNTAPTQLNGQSTYAFPTSATNPLGWTAYAQVDYFTGAAVNAEDINGVISKTLYNDPLDRPTQTVTAVGLPNYERQTTIIYDDDVADRRVEIKSDLNTLNDNLLKTESFYDGLGRTVESRRYESDGNFIVTNSVPFVMIQDPQTSVWRAATKVSNPYRPNEPIFWTTSLSDSLGRGIKVITPDGAIIKTEYSGNAVTVTDQAGNQRRSITNALEQLKEVHEPNNAGQLGAIGSPNQPTYYNYDVLNNLLQVQQNGVNTNNAAGQQQVAYKPEPLLTTAYRD